MLKVGLTGGYATGKSFVAAELARLGCHLIYADKLGHAVLEPAGEAYQPVVEQFGPPILREDGTIDRKQLGKIVFAAPDQLAQLTAIVHPAVFRLEERLFKQFNDEDPQGTVVVEAAILIETGRFSQFDRLLLTVCDEEVQIRRGSKRDGISRDEAMARIHRQMPVEEKRRYAHYVIDTSGPKEKTLQEVGRVFQKLRA